MSGADEQPYIFVSHASADNWRLKPVLVALLEAGIPLWFDKPQHRQIRISPNQFAGHAPFRRRWMPSTLDAIAHSAGVLVFASAAAARSGEVMREIGFAQSQLKHRGEQFALISALLGANDANYEGRFTGGERAFSTFVSEGQAGAAELTPEGLLDVEELIEELKPHLAKQRLAKCAAVAGRNSVVPFLADRAHQRELALSAFEDLSRPPVFVVHGAYTEAPNRFSSVTFPRQIVGSRGIFSRADATAAPLRVRLPTAGAGASGFELSFARLLSEAYQGCAPPGASSGPQVVGELTRNVASAVRRDGVTRLVVSELDAETLGDRSTLAALKAWVGFWNAFPFDHAHASGRFLLIPMVEVVHSQVRGRWNGFLRRRLQMNLDSPDFGRRLTAIAPRITPRVLPCLPSITRALARDWVINDDLFQEHPEDLRESLIEEFATFFRDTPALPMRDWARLAAPPLEAAGIR